MSSDVRVVAAALFALLAVALLGPVQVADAATFVVNSTADAPDFQPGNGVCDSTSGAGTCTLRAAINEANTLGGSHTINLGSGTYNLSLAGTGEEAGLTGDLDVYANLTIVGTGVATTIIDGQSLDRVFDLHNTGETVFRSLTITHGTATNGNGGGILAIGPVTLDTVTLTANQATGSAPAGNGGGISSSGPLTVLSTTVSSNIAPNGGGIYGTTVTIGGSILSANQGNIGAAIYATSVSMNRSNMDANIASGAFTAGGIVALGDLTIVDSTVTNTQAAFGINTTKLVMTGTTVRGNGGGGANVTGIATIAGSTLSENGGPGLNLLSESSSATIERSTISRNTGGITSQGSMTLRHVTVSENVGLGEGGGISSWGSVTIEDSTIAGNRANRVPFRGPANGGGVAVFMVNGSRPSLTVVRSLVTGNISADDGGGLYHRSVFGTAGVSVEDSTISANEGGSKGGGIFSDTAIQATRSTIKDNTAGSTGGGIYSSVVVLNASTVSGNTARGAGGVLGSTIQATDSTISGNTASADGGGGVFAPASVELTRSTVSGNTATNNNGGGISSAGAVTLTNATISGNTVTGDGTVTGRGGGVFYNPPSSTSGTWTNTTITANAAPRGAGLYVLTSGLQLKNVLIANNSGSTDCFRVSPVTSLGHNLDGGSSCGFSVAGDLSNANAGLGPLANNGGPTKTHALQAGSAAIDAGDNVGCPATDQRGEARPKDGNGDGTAVCDIGAFEGATASGPPPPTTCSPRPRVALQTQQTGPGKIQSTVSATGAGNVLTQIQVTALTNATITVNGVAAIAGQAIPLPAGSTSAAVVVTRAAPGAFTARLSVTDGCGAWPTFVGGGTGIQ